MSTPITGVLYSYDAVDRQWIAPARATLPAVDVIQPGAEWTPAQLGFLDRPTGSGYIAAESLTGMSGVTDLRAISAAATAQGHGGKVLTLPTGTFTLNDFVQGEGTFMHGLFINNPATQIRGIIGSGAGTIVKMVANSSHFTELTAQQPTTPPQYSTTAIWFYQVNNVEVGNFTMEGTAQPHFYHGLRINGASLKVHHIRFRGAGYGSFNMPPGETYTLAVSGSNPVIEDCEFDGRRPDNTKVSSTVIGTLGSTNTVIRRCYAHDMLSGFGVVQWQGSGMTTEDFWVARPGTGTSGYNGCHSNHEEGSGPIRHIRPHIELDAIWKNPIINGVKKYPAQPDPRTLGKFGHFVFLQETLPAGGPLSYADSQIIEPVYDTWGGIPGGFGITRDITTAHPAVIVNGITRTPVVRPKWWEDNPPINVNTQYWVSGTSGNESVWG